MKKRVVTWPTDTEAAVGIALGLLKKEGRTVADLIKEESE